MTCEKIKTSFETFGKVRIAFERRFEGIIWNHIYFRTSRVFNRNVEFAAVLKCMYILDNWKTLHDEYISPTIGLGTAEIELSKIVNIMWSHP